MLDRYCERAAEGLWAEPVNVVSNLGFVVAAVLGARAYRREPGLSRREWDLWLLLAAVFAVGVGSSLWHLFAMPWALRADTLPIMLFINVYLLSCLFCVIGTPIGAGILLFAGYHLLNQLIARSVPAETLNASVYYLPSWLFLAGIAGYLTLRRAPHWHLFVSATAIFTLSLIFRTLDQRLCAMVPMGTHFVWHLLNAVMLYVLLLGLIRAAARGQGARGG